MYGYFSMHYFFEALWRVIYICDPYRHILDTMAEQGSRRAVARRYRDICLLKIRF